MMEQLNPPLTAAAVPPLFARCFMADCPLADSCARHLAGLYLPEDTCMGIAVFPNARQGDSCKAYKPTRTIRGAYGFTALFDNVKERDGAPLRRAIKKLLGGNGTYDRYHHGPQLLTPQQQEAIMALFRKRGYTEPLHFDVYRDVVDFSEK